MQKALEDTQTKLNALEAGKKRQAGEIESRLKMIASEKTRLGELLQQKERVISELELHARKTNLDLEKALKFQAALESLSPTLIEFKERLEAIERIQSDLSNRVLRLVRKSEEPPQDSGLLEIIRRLFHPQHRSPSLNQ